MKKAEMKDVIKEKPSAKNSKKKIITKKIKSASKIEKKSINFSLVEVIIIVIVTGLVISIASGYIIYKNYDKINEEFGKKEIQKDKIEEFLESYNNILNSYVEKVDEDGLIDSAIEGMYNFLEDTYSDYLSKSETDTLQERLKGQYHGIGVEITSSVEMDYVVIVTVFENTPASVAGLKVGDEIVAINGENMKDKDSLYVSTTIKNNSAKSVNITYRRDGKEDVAVVKINNVTIPSVSSKMYDSVGYINITTFSATTPTQFKEELEELEKSGMKSLVIDVRDNSGGYLSSATSISELFLDKGQIIYQLKDREGLVTSYKAKSGDKKDYKVVVIINGASASASEILAAALKESYGATLVGITSYGKGTIQETNTLSSGAMVKYTSAYWLTPNGNMVNEIGIKPDIQVLETGTEKDITLEKAIETAK